MACLSTFQSGPKGSERVQNAKPGCFWQFGTLLGPSGHFWILSDKNKFFARWGQRRVWRRCFWKKKVPNCQKHRGLPFWTFWGFFGPLWNVDKPAMFSHFCLVYWCAFCSSSFIFLSFHCSVFSSFCFFRISVFLPFHFSGFSYFFFSSFWVIVFLSKLFLVHLNS